MASDDVIVETPKGEWKADDEAALVRRHNQGVSESKPGDALKARQLGRTSDPTDDPRINTSHATQVDEQDDKPRSAPPPDGFISYVRDWFAERKLERDKANGMDPYVVVKMGRNGKQARTEAFCTSNKDPPEVYRNPMWTEEHGRDLTVERSPNDRGELIVEVYDEGLTKDRFIGSCHVHLQQFIQYAEETADWQHVMFHLYDQQDIADPDEDQRDAGGIHALVRWVPKLRKSTGTWAVDSNGRAKGVLKVKVLAGTDLRDISTLRISDISSFADTGSTQLTLYVMISFLVFFSLFYRYVVWSNLKAVDGSSHGLDSVLFVVTTFTTVGYGDHPQLLETPFERLVTTAFVISGMGILGVTIGTWGDMIKVKVDQKKRRAREKLLRLAQGTGQITDQIIASDDIRNQVVAKLRKKFDKGDDWTPDEHEVQTEMGKVLIRRFWKDELRQLVFGLAGLAGILWLGTAVFTYTEQEECFVSEKTVANADEGCLVGQNDPQTGLENDGREGRPMAGDLISPGKTQQGLRVIDALYFTTVTASTVGYGDVTPQSWMGKLFAIVYIPIAVALMSKTIMSIVMIPMEYRRLRLEAYVLDQFGDELSAPDFVELKASINIHAEETIRKNDFTLAMLLRLGRVGKYDITRIEQVFSQLDGEYSFTAELNGTR
eukprot:COSAG02_NODE_3304_length_6976_cov_6.587902_5_plen_662_part_00